MYVAIRRYAVDPRIYSDLKERLETDFVPLLKRIAGFSAYYAIDTGRDSLVTVSVFESEKGERESTLLAAEFVKRNYPNAKVERVTLDEGSCIVEQHAAIPV